MGWALAPGLQSPTSACAKRAKHLDFLRSPQLDPAAPQLSGFRGLDLFGIPWILSSETGLFNGLRAPTAGKKLKAAGIRQKMGDRDGREIIHHNFVSNAPRLHRPRPCQGRPDAFAPQPLRTKQEHESPTESRVCRDRLCGLSALALLLRSDFVMGNRKRRHNRLRRLKRTRKWRGALRPARSPSRGPRNRHSRALRGGARRGSGDCPQATCRTDAISFIYEP